MTIDTILEKNLSTVSFWLVVYRRMYIFFSFAFSSHVVILRILLSMYFSAPRIFFYFPLLCYYC